MMPLEPGLPGSKIDYKRPSHFPSRWMPQTIKILYQGSILLYLSWCIDKKDLYVSFGFMSPLMTFITDVLSVISVLE